MKTSNERACVAEPDPDAALVAQAQQGDRRALEALYRKYVGRIYNLVFRITADRQRAEDMTQEAFLQIYRSLHRFQGRSRFYTWAFRVATNVALARARSTAHADREVPFDDHHASPSAYADPELSAERRDMFERLEAAMRRMPPQLRAMIVLGPIQSHTYEQIAEILGISVDAVKGRMYRARVNLHAVLSSQASIFSRVQTVRNVKEGAAA